ncbi:MAG: hypothetical protein GY719_27620 [bacterium]|nr:hypothetical protein [bacterium]
MDDNTGEVLALMQRIDEGYATGAADAVLDLEEELERRLWFLEHYLEALEEDEELQVDDGDPDAEVGVEEQFIALWHAFNSDHGSFAGLAEASQEHLRDVLECACLRGMAPRHLRVDALPALLPIARELAEDRQALIARYRAQARRWGRGPLPSPTARGAERSFL